MPNVKIRIESGTETAGDGKERQESKELLQKQKEETAAIAMFTQKMIGTAKQILNYRVSNIGLFSGNYIRQDQVNFAMEMINDVTTLGMGFVSGGLVGGGIAIAGLVTKVVMEQISGARADLSEQRNTSYLLARSGNATRYGSRDTEN